MKVDKQGRVGRGGESEEGRRRGQRGGPTVRGGRKEEVPPGGREGGKGGKHRGNILFSTIIRNTLVCFSEPYILFVTGNVKGEVATYMLANLYLCTYVHILALS